MAANISAEYVAIPIEESVGEPFILSVPELLPLTREEQRREIYLGWLLCTCHFVLWLTLLGCILYGLIWVFSKK